jgi:hypothetical protein
MTRAAELTTENGYNYFIITSSSNEVLGKSSFFSEMPGRSITIKCFKEKPSEAEVSDAHFLLKEKKNKNK